MVFPGEANFEFFNLPENDNLKCTLEPCTEGQNCSSNDECITDTGCATDLGFFADITSCRNTEHAKMWKTIVDIAVPAALVVLLVHLTLNYYLEFKAKLAARARRLKKAAKYKNATVALDGDSAILAADLDDEEEMTGEYEFEDANGNIKKKRWSQAIRDSEAMHKKYREDVMDCLERSQGIISSIRKSASIVKVDTHVMSDKSLKVATMYRVLCLVFLNDGSLLKISKKNVGNIVEVIESCADKLERSLRSSVQKSEVLLNRCENLILDAAEEINEHAKDHKINFDIAWDLYDPQFQKFQAKVYKKLHPEDPYHTMTTLMLTHGVTSSNNVGGDLVQQAKRKVGIKSTIKKLLVKLLPIPAFVKHFPLFYTFFFGSAFIVFLSFTLSKYQSNLELQNSGIRGTFLPVPGYYDVNDGNKEMQSLVPFIYGFMHMALYFLCWIPVPMTRGVLRDLSLAFPGLRHAVPIDDAYFFHKVIAMCLLMCLVIGAGIFAFVVGRDCINAPAGESNACFAYDPIAPANIKPVGFSLNPIQNVFMLRKIVWLTWFPLFPMLHWANVVPKWAPAPLKKYWYEIWFYAHHFTAHVSIVLALISRFEVFYPTLGTWGLYYLDKLREMKLRTKDTEIIVRPVFVSQEENPDDAQSSTIHLDDKNQPNSMRLLIEVPPGFKVNAGQWIYLKVPSVSSYQWHPFSLASAARDNFVELHVGIRGNKSQWKKTKDKEDPWVMTKSPTWTYKLYRQLRERVLKMADVEDPERQSEDVKPLYCKIRGPYGSTFTKCFDPHYYGSIIIGAGTGLTAAESVLRELFWRKRQKARVPKYAWFIWSCQRVDDLLWAWSSLHKLLFKAAKDGILSPGAKWNEESLMLDWLGIYFYVSRADKDRLDNFVNKKFDTDSDDEDDDADSEVKASVEDEIEDLEDGAKKKRKAKKEYKTLSKDTGIKDLVSDSAKDEALSDKIHAWMGNRRRLFLGSMDDPEYHVEKVFVWSRLFVDRKAGKHKKLALCFCGPPGLAHTLDAAATKVGNKDGMQFSADHQ